MKVVGYGICGPGEAKRYMRQTLDQFAELCDDVIILLNGELKDLLPERNLIQEYGFNWAHDTREWGKLQWLIKQDFVSKQVAKFAHEGDMLVCLDMDEVLDSHMTKNWLVEAELDAYNVFVVNLWDAGYRPEQGFWNVRLWRWNGNTEWEQKPVHCGLAPKWAYHYHRFAPFLLLHYGLKKKKDRMKKIERYERYDPEQQFTSKEYYRALSQDTCVPFDEEALHATIAKEVATYKQTKPRGMIRPDQKKIRFAYVRNPHGNTVDIPEKDVAETLRRGGFTFLGWADDAQKEIEQMFEDEPEGTYQRPMESERREVDELEHPDALPIVETEVDTHIQATENPQESFTTPELVETALEQAEEVQTPPVPAKRGRRAKAK